MLELLLVLSIIAEWLIFLIPGLWRYRRYTIVPALILTALTTSGLAFATANIAGVLVGLVGMFRVLNQLRIAEDRMHKAYLLHVTRRTGLLLGLTQVALAYVAMNIYINPSGLLGLTVVAQAVLAFAILLITIRNIVRSKHRPLLENYADRELPTVTIAIPARNETEELEDCLRSILANNYPKFEVIVLDDCSQDKTPEVIRSFAQDGVRFIKGAEPSERWLAKNQAYDRLAKEATGELILFCGVDVRFGPETIRALVTTMLGRQKDMVSILPRRLSSDVKAALIQPMRYWWELALPRRYFNRPPVLSTCWVIRRKVLKKLGGFEAVQHTIIPEGFFARELVKTDKYSFIRADDLLDVQTRKSLPGQRETAIRMRYPQLRRRPEWVMLLILGEVIFLLGPFALLLTAFWSGFGPAQFLGAISTALLVLTHVVIVQISNPANTLVAFFNFPLAILTELALGTMSMLKYEFSTVDWKGRNICEPVMHVVPKLPDIKS